ncbi:hypothetical protein J2X68_005839 [Streptomyces sp. 3330]|uniref:hypothetical protein n=1 Tax=Streptomyces sp. 3330 TaxID=2817755 RepID=UPI0028579E7F|nr:hypothetical protein [Streptomyces sp. 3330]MDR6979105.1 hypothetical protein [Streptomyces sp. 3330]
MPSGRFGRDQSFEERNLPCARPTVVHGGGYAVAKDWNLSIAEGTTLQIRACLQDTSSGTPYSCGGWEYARA